MKKIAFAIVVLVLGGLIWYLFLKPSDYIVSFKVKTFPGTIQQSIKIWDSALDSTEILDQEGILKLTQQLQFGDSTHIYKWKIVPINDSLSKVKVYARDKDHSLKNKIAIPFSDTDFEKRTRKTLLDFNKDINEHIESFGVQFIGEEELKSTYCACTTLNTSQIGKAQGMMKDFPLLSTILVNNGVKLNGKPFIEITDWDMETDSLKYNFCYPILPSEQLPKHPELKFKQLYAKKSLKAIYNGNYITSDRAWYALLDYAKKNKLEVTGLPVEIFFNNPNMGGDALNWKAEIYIPLKSLDE